MLESVVIEEARACGRWQCWPPPGRDWHPTAEPPSAILFLRASDRAMTHRIRSARSQNRRSPPPPLATLPAARGNFRPRRSNPFGAPVATPVHSDHNQVYSSGTKLTPARAGKPGRCNSEFDVAWQQGAPSPRHWRPPAPDSSATVLAVQVAPDGVFIERVGASTSGLASSPHPTTKSRSTSRSSPAAVTSVASRSGRITMPEPHVRGRAR